MSAQQEVSLADLKKHGGYWKGMWVPPWKCERFPHLFARSCIVSSSGNTRIPHMCQEPLGHRDHGTPHECACKYRWTDGQLRRRNREIRRQGQLSFWQRLVKAWRDVDPGLDESEEDPEWEKARWDGRIW